MHRQLLGDSQTDVFPGILPTGRHPTVCEDIDKKKYNRKNDKSIKIERTKRCTRRVNHPFFPCEVEHTTENVYIGCKSVNMRPEKTRVQPFSETELKKRTQTKSLSNANNNSSSTKLQTQKKQTMSLKTRSMTRTKNGE